MIEREIAEFGRRMGMPAFSLSPAGLAALDVERLGRLHLELAENAGERELLVYLARAVPEYDVKAPRRVLERCHYRHADPMPLSGGYKGNIVLQPVSNGEATAVGIERLSVPQRRHGYRRQSLIPQPRFSLPAKEDSHAEHQPSGSFPRHPDHHGEPGGNARRHPRGEAPRLQCPARGRA
ncbi:MAG: hypothetical protein ACLTTU_12715 [Bilophila wadsworthia]